ncbi:3-ketoacyl-CoA thiolase, mitochondrial [Eumeta japonica]|uniref:3-ketoacyl-CoA thiolase, mitochondrial n=1 Tax=Eumeta variegata TaxID=151549 RepID=A0A4C1XIX6_EUMVA|nr:3-ketoacyl-CoA thiolase, mitochondrial [Eumeta japonica]
MALLPKGIFIVGAKRTPFGAYGGVLKDTPASHAFAVAAREAFKSANVDPALVDTTIVGNVNFLSQCDGGKTPRYCGTYSGVPLSKPALGVNKACGSGYQAIINGAMDIVTGVAKVSLTGGTENMSSLPLLVRNVRFGTTLGASYQVEECVSHQALDSFSGLTLVELTENMAKKNGITKREADEFTIESHKRWKAAFRNGLFNSEIAAMTMTVGDHEVEFRNDSLPNPEIKLEEIARHTPISGTDGIITTGNSAPVADGAAALILASEEALKAHSWTPLVRLVGWACIGVDPDEMNSGAVVATKKLLNMAKYQMKDMDLVEINDSFSAHVLACNKELDADIRKVNVSGGSMALGYAPGSSTARAATHLVHQLMYD